MLSASCEEVFDAWLDEEGMPRWMCPGPVTSCKVTLEPRVGGHFHIVMTAPNTEIVSTGEFRVLDRASKLEFTWVSSRWGHQETLITVKLHRCGTQCELVLTHEQFPHEHSARGLEQGWNQIMEKLDNYFA
jgi:uncharacterized protein YndB with AHSA1/START domain